MGRDFSSSHEGERVDLSPFHSLTLVATFLAVPGLMEDNDENA